MKATNHVIEWATEAKIKQPAWMRFCEQMEIKAWSRQFEYPWAITNGKFKPGNLVLDAGGGNGMLQFLLSLTGCRVMNADSDPCQVVVTEKKKHPDWYGNIELVNTDLASLPFPDRCFDNAACVSVLEHIDNPWPVLSELWRVLKIGGRLLLTFDVASYRRWNHSIDYGDASRIVGWLGGSFGSAETDYKIVAEFDEVEPKLGEPKSVYLACLGVACDKVE